MITLPLPSFADRPLHYFLWYLLIIVVLSLWPFNFLQRNEVTWEPAGGLMFTPPSIAYTTIPPAKLNGLHEWTILLDASAFPFSGIGRIMGYSLNERRFNLTLDQATEDLVLRIRTGTGQRSREIRVERFVKPNASRRFRLAMIYNGGNLSLYMDGERRAHERIGQIEDSAWGADFPLVFGSRADGTFGWKGLFHRFVVFPHAMSPAALESTGVRSPGSPTLLCYEFNELSGRTVMDHSDLNPVSLSWPERFVPYHRTILQSPREYWPEFRHPYWGDILANIIAYLPMGYLISILVKPRLPSAVAAVLPVIAALCLSLTVEVLQAYLPTRNSSLMDVMTNGLGGALGVLAHRGGWVEKLFSALHVTFRQSTMANKLST